MASQLFDFCLFTNCSLHFLTTLDIFVQYYVTFSLPSHCSHHAFGLLEEILIYLLRQTQPLSCTLFTCFVHTYLLTPLLCLICQYVPSTKLESFSGPDQHWMTRFTKLFGILRHCPLTPDPGRGPLVPVWPLSISPLMNSTDRTCIYT